MRIKTVLWIGGGLVAAYLLYQWWWSSPNSPGYSAEKLREGATPSPFQNL